MRPGAGRSQVRWSPPPSFSTRAVRSSGLRIRRRCRRRSAPAWRVLIRTRALAWGVGWSDSEEIDSLNILQASLLAMRRALLCLPLCPTHVQVDGDCPPRLADLLVGCTVETIVKGDAKVDAISAASILAKTFRDALMERMDEHYPGFDLAAHKGYATPAHLAASRLRAPTPLHRRSFEPVREAMAIMVH